MKVADVFKKHPYPVLTPTNRDWEDFCVFNPAVVEKDGLIYLIYRAMGKDKISRLGLAWSKDGISFSRLDKPVFSPEGPQEQSGVEDPRIVKIGDFYYMTYTAYRGWDPAIEDHDFVIAMARSKDLIRWERLGYPLGSEKNKDAVLFPEKIKGKYAMFHRRPPSIWIAFSDDLRSWYGHQVIMEPVEGTWEGEKIGAGGPPIKTDEGWLVIYHGVGRDRHGMRVYALGLALLDLEDPTKIIARYPHPVLYPEFIWERKGDVPCVVFTDGAVVVDGSVYLYYGAADTVVGFARAELGDLLDLLKENPL